MKSYKNIKQRIKDKHINALLSLSREVNFIFNFMNNLYYEHTFHDRDQCCKFGEFKMNKKDLTGKVFKLIQLPNRINNTTVKLMLNDKLIIKSIPGFYNKYDYVLNSWMDMLGVGKGFKWDVSSSGMIKEGFIIHGLMVHCSSSIEKRNFIYSIEFI